ncbi:MAG: hypothetical protein HQ514_01870 [Rhodospirillales bacterium]|nr:hypothetical protein [Rhodospirillales bacterium]
MDHGKISREELVERARALIPMLRADADAAEKRRMITPETIAPPSAMREYSGHFSRSASTGSNMISAW